MEEESPLRTSKLRPHTHGERGGAGEPLHLCWHINWWKTFLYSWSSCCAERRRGRGCREEEPKERWRAAGVWRERGLGSDEGREVCEKAVGRTASGRDWEEDPGAGETDLLSPAESKNTE